MWTMLWFMGKKADKGFCWSRPPSAWLSCTGGGGGGAAGGTVCYNYARCVCVCVRCRSWTFWLLNVKVCDNKPEPEHGGTRRRFCLTGSAEWLHRPWPAVSVRETAVTCQPGFLKSSETIRTNGNYFFFSCFFSPLWPDTFLFFYSDYYKFK